MWMVFYCLFICVKQINININTGRLEPTAPNWPTTDRRLGVSETQNPLQIPNTDQAKKNSYSVFYSVQLPSLFGNGASYRSQVVLLVIYLVVSFTVYHPRTGYSNRSRCSSTSSSVASPGLLETPPPTQTQSTPSEHRPPPNKQVSWGKQFSFTP